jgi:tetratricopeptide (TPR) repeat protein
MQGLTTSFSTFGEDGVDIEAFERELKDKKMFPVINFWYHVLKLTARYISGDYDEAMAASKVAEPIVWSARTMATYPEYCFFTAMTTAMLHAGASEEARAQHRDVVTTYVEQLRAWSESCPENYLNKYSLAAAELARIEGRLDDAARLLDQAVRASQSNEFVQIEGLSHEVAARFYLDRGDVEKAHSHLREAHACFRRWGAHGKVKQLEELYPDALQALP